MSTRAAAGVSRAQILLLQEPPPDALLRSGHRDYLVDFNRRSSPLFDRSSSRGSRSTKTNRYDFYQKQEENLDTHYPHKNAI